MKPYRNNVIGKRKTADEWWHAEPVNHAPSRFEQNRERGGENKEIGWVVVVDSPFDALDF
jgi:hypothetical protein